MADEPIQQEVRTFPARSGRGFVLFAVLLLGATVFSLVGLVRERRRTRELAARNAEMSLLLSETRGRLDALSSKVKALVVPPALAPAPHRPVVSRTGERREPVTPAAHKPRVAEDPRWKQIQTDLAEHKAGITATREDLARTRSDLERNLQSTRDDLSASVARTDGELAGLKKRGERNYYTFNLTKSKGFQRVGPISLSLRKADTKHRRYDATMLVDDFELSKKRVNLFEPVWVYVEEGAQPLELVVNRIEKNQVHGYVSEPKYKFAEAAENAPASADSKSSSSSEVDVARRSEPQP